MTRMTIGVGGSTQKIEIQRLQLISQSLSSIADIKPGEYKDRILKAQSIMKTIDLDAIYLNAGTNMYYFTGTQWHASERMVGAIIPQNGPVTYLCPWFEKSTLKDFMSIPGKTICWNEHESPYKLFVNLLSDIGIKSGKVGMDESTPYFIIDGVSNASPDLQLVNAKEVTSSCRMKKSEHEIALLQRAKDITLEVHKSAAAILKPGINTLEVCQFINKAHKAMGIAEGSSFCIALFGEATAYPHGVKDPQILKENDMVLIDTGCLLNGYNSDITRTYVYGEASTRQREVWDIEKEAQASAFKAAQIGEPCSSVDKAARKTLEKYGFGPGYKIPGLPHRTGHGIGLDIHEWPYLVMSDHTCLEKGMCFSNEPMICIPGEFGVRHEDHFYMTDGGPRWFTQPAHSIDNPFGLTTIK